MKQKRLASNGRILVRPTKWDVFLPARRGEGSSSYDEDDEEDDDDNDDDEIFDEAIVNTEDGHDETEDNPAMQESIKESSTSSVESEGRRIRHTSSDEDSEVLNRSAQEGTANPPKEKASEEDSEVLNGSAQKGTANPPEGNPNAAASSLVRFDGNILVGGMSKEESVTEACCRSSCPIRQVGCFLPYQIRKQRCNVPEGFSIGDKTRKCTARTAIAVSDAL